MALGEAGQKKLRLIINRATADDSISAEYIQKFVRFPVYLSISNSYFEVMRAINAGEPVAPGGASAFNQQMADWTHRIAVGEELRVTQKSPRRRLRLWPLGSAVKHA